jgi:hypothetical protein
MKVFINNKNGKNYYMSGECINKTNKQDRQVMILYTDNVNMYVREEKEFYEKFTELK